MYRIYEGTRDEADRQRERHFNYIFETFATCFLLVIVLHLDDWTSSLG